MYEPSDFPRDLYSPMSLWSGREMAHITNTADPDPAALTYLASVSNQFAGAISNKMGSQAYAQMVNHQYALGPSGLESPTQQEVMQMLGTAGFYPVGGQPSWEYPKPTTF
jgi:hypothetical protein